MARIIDIEFSPAAAAAISGVSTELQKKWRFRGFLGEQSTGRWTRWSGGKLCRLTLIGAMANLVGPAMATRTLGTHDVDAGGEWVAHMANYAELALYDRALYHSGLEVREVRSHDPSSMRFTDGMFLASDGDRLLVGGSDMNNFFPSVDAMIVVSIERLAKRMVADAGGAIARAEA